MTFVARKRFVPIVIVIVTHPVITGEAIIPGLHAGTAARPVPRDPSFPPSPFYLHANKGEVSARYVECMNGDTNEFGIN